MRSTTFCGRKTDELLWWRNWNDSVPTFSASRR
jgi:hypothetical protein